MILSAETPELEQAIVEKNIEKVKSIVAKNDIDYSVIELVLQQPTIDFRILLFLIKHADTPSAIDSHATIVSDIKKSINLNKRLIKYKEIQELLETIDVVDAHWLSYSDTEAAIITFGKNKEYVIKYATRHSPVITRYVGRLCIELHYNNEKKAFFDLKKPDFNIWSMDDENQYKKFFKGFIEAFSLEAIKQQNPEKSLFELFSYFWSRQVQKGIIPAKYASMQSGEYATTVAMKLLRTGDDWTKIDNRLSRGQLTKNWKNQAIKRDIELIHFLSAYSSHRAVAFNFIQILSCPKYPEEIITYAANIISRGHTCFSWRDEFQQPAIEYLCDQMLPIADKIIDKNLE